MASKCVWLRPAPLTAHYAKLTASASARSRRSVLLPCQRSLNENHASSRHSLLMGITAALKCAITCAKSFASASSIPTWSSLTPWTSAGPRPYAKPPASRSRTSLPTWPTGPRRTAMHCSASSTVICRRKKVQHEALFRKPPACRSVGHRLRSRRIIPRPDRASAVSLAHTEALLLNPLRCSRAQASRRVFDHRTPLLHTQSDVETELGFARFRL